MKIKIQMKDPDVMHDAVADAVWEELRASHMPKDEQDVLYEVRSDKVRAICATWFRYSEYLTVEVDTEAMTCTVLPADA